MEHSFNVEIAREYGIPSAILLNQIVACIRDNERTGANRLDGKTWACQSARDLADRLPYFSSQIIKRTLAYMVQSGLLERGTHQEKSMNHTAWYTLTDKANAMVQYCTIDGTEMTHRRYENEPSTGQNCTIAETLTGQGFADTSTNTEEAKNDASEEEPYIYTLFLDKDNDNHTYTDNHTDNSTVKKKDIYAEKRREILDYLNRKAGTKYRDGAIAQKHINARLNEGYTVEDFKTVIDSKCAEWLRTDMAKYLRPETLFGTKMDGYLGQAGMKARTVGPNGIAMDPDLLEDEELKAIFG